MQLFATTLARILLISALTSICPAWAASHGGEGADYRTFLADGTVRYGKIGDSYTADLVMYLAGNQYMVVEDLVREFLQRNPDINSVYVATIPPGQLLQAHILKQGQVYGQNTAQNPDLFASVDLRHLTKLKQKGLMSDYMVYGHNKLELMVARGNPKSISGPKDLARDDLVQSHPNPLTEGIFIFYGSQMLKDLGIYEVVTGNAMCRSCWAVPGRTWFTSQHHRETPQRIENGEADVGIVWATEVAHAKRLDRQVDGVAIPVPFNMQHKVSYAIGVLQTGRNKGTAYRYLDYLASDTAQAIYASYGFTPASDEELAIRPIPQRSREKASMLASDARG